MTTLRYFSWVRRCNDADKKIGYLQRSFSSPNGTHTYSKSYLQPSTQKCAWSNETNVPTKT